MKPWQKAFFQIQIIVNAIYSSIIVSGVDLFHSHFACLISRADPASHILCATGDGACDVSYRHSGGRTADEF